MSSRPCGRLTFLFGMLLTRTVRVRSNLNSVKGAGMGDKGGKKDKEKSKQQQVKEEKEEAQRKQDKARPRTP
jgi:hypothetical protein